MLALLLMVTMLLLLMLTLQDVRAEGQGSLHFSPDGKRQVFLHIAHQVLTVSDQPDGPGRNLPVDTENPVTMKVDDYNFDGYRDFSLSYVGGGMGTYTVYRLFVYAPASRGFVEIHPACGDEFMNVRLARRERKLINAYYADNVIKTCAKKY